MKPKLLSLVFIAALLSSCGVGGDSSGGAEATPTATVVPTAISPAEIQPVNLPADEAPHQNMTEWWYYTGHMFDASGNRYGFEFVIFQVRQGDFPAYYASHFAITDNAAGEFSYDQKSGFNAQVDAEQGFHLSLDGWEMEGANGRDKLKASMDGYAIDLTLTTGAEPVLHNRGTGYMDIAAAGGSYYYSRPEMDLTGTFVIGDSSVQVTGTAWMDHQWGDFTLIDGGGWDWFSVQLDDGGALMVFQLRGTEAAGDIPDFGTLVQPDGAVIHLAEGDYSIDSRDTWTSETSGATYPIGWTISVPAYGLSISLEPSMLDQELDTTASTRTIYWEGEVVVDGTRGDAPVAGLGYVELTGYATEDLITP